MADTVQHLRLRGGGGTGAVGRRHRAEATLAGGLPAPRGLPAGALLCVRRVGLRLPVGALSSVPRQAAPRLQQQLDEAWAVAVRPGAGSPGAAVPALWFADAAELLVFVARRAQAGDTAAWWWPALAGTAAPPQAAAAGVWQRQAQAVPAAVMALGDAALAVCAALGTPACEVVAQAVARVFRVPAWGRVERGDSRPETTDAAGAEPHRPPWRAEAAVARQAPSSAPHPSHMTDGPRPPGTRPATGPDAAPAAPTSAAARLVALARVLAREPWSATAAGLAERVGREARALAAMGSVSPAAAPIGDGAPTPPATDAVTPGTTSPSSRRQRAPALADHRGVERPRADGMPPHSDVSTATLSWPRPSRCLTPHAGLFFLVPLLQRQGVLGDFTAPARAGPGGHAAWLLLALLRRLAARQLHDPLPELLKTWAGAARRPRGPVPWRSGFTALVMALQADAAQRLGRPPRGTLAWLVRQPGWVQLGLSRLDVGFDLQRHPFAIRAAGLDRDIGWLPAGGRHLAFHFDAASPGPAEAA